MIQQWPQQGPQFLRRNARETSKHPKRGDRGHGLDSFRKRVEEVTGFVKLQGLGLFVCGSVWVRLLLIEGTNLLLI